MDIGSAVTYVTKDKDWLKKILIAAVCVLTGIGAIAAAGWMMEIIRRVIRGDTDLLPEWSDFGKIIMDGLKMVGAVLVWLLPIILIGACAGGASALMGRQATRWIAYVGWVLGGCLGIPYTIAFALLVPAQVGILAHTGSFGQAINPTNAFKLLRANIGGYVIAALVSILAAGIVAPLGVIACVVGLFFAEAYAYAIIGHLNGQATRLALEKTGQLA